MRRLPVVAALTAAIALVAPVAASAGNPHFKHGGTPVCTVTSSGSASSTTCTASLTGLGNGDVTISVTVSGFAVYQCQNGGGNIAPGQNRVLVGPTTTPTTIPGSAIKNGNLSFTTNPATLSADSSVSGAVAGCPNSNWTGVNPVLTVTSIELAISQGGNTFYDQTVSNPNGLSGAVAFPA
jgi:hypothetical protein